ncbi:MAG: MBL fold metallo-hydrolase [Myxococcota bacterium]
MTEHPHTRTRIDAVGDGVYRIHTPVSEIPGGFSFNQYLVVDDEALLFHCGLRALADPILEAIGSVVPIERLRWIGVSHMESDECGGLNRLLAAAPNAQPVCGQTGAMISMNDFADRPPRPLEDGEVLTLGGKRLRWIDAPFVPHGWDCGYLFEETGSTLLCGDFFTQPGTGEAPVVEGDILGPSEAFRARMDYFSHAPHTAATIGRLAGLEPELLACMHGSAWRGDGKTLLTELGEALGR